MEDLVQQFANVGFTIFCVVVGIILVFPYNVTFIE